MRAGVRVVVPVDLAHQLPGGRQGVGEAHVRVDQVGVRPVAHVGQVFEVVGEGEAADPARAPREVVGVAHRAAVVVLRVFVLLLDVGEAGLLVEGPLAREVVLRAVQPLVAEAGAEAVAVLEVVDAVALVLAVQVGVDLGRPEVVELRAEFDAVLGLLLVVARRAVLGEVVAEATRVAVLVPAAGRVRRQGDLLARRVAARGRAAEVDGAVPGLGLGVDGLDALHVERPAREGVGAVLEGHDALRRRPVDVLDRVRLAHVVRLERDLVPHDPHDLARQAGPALEDDRIGRNGPRTRHRARARRDSSHRHHPFNLSA